MTAAWKALELRVAKALGGRRAGPLGAATSDIVGVPFAVECKRCTRYQLRSAWIEQARRQSKAEGNPWLLVIAEHGDRRALAVCDFLYFVQVAQQAGLVPTPLDLTDAAPSQ